jgi:hypothetical protein
MWWLPYRAKVGETTKDVEKHSDRNPTENISRKQPSSEYKSATGNQAMQHLFQSGGVHAAPTISEPGDPHEQEADEVADHITGRPESSATEDGTMDRKAEDYPLLVPKSGSSKSLYEVGEGRPLDSATRKFFEPRLGYDLGKVLLHTDARASDAAESMHANAFTSGSDILFGAGRFVLGTQEGRRLLAHELAHVVQQTALSQKSAPLGSPRFDREVDPSQAKDNPTPENYVKNYYNWFGLNLQEEKLASDLYLLAWQSPSHYEFVYRVFKLLSKDNQIEVAEAFFAQLRSDSFIEEFALTSEGRSFLTSIALYLPVGNRQQERSEKILLAGPQAEREREREKSLEALKKRGGTADITFYTSYKEMDTAEALLESIAKEREARKATDAALPIESFENVGVYLAEIAQLSRAAGYIRGLHLMGHGTENNFGFGKYYP